MILFNLDQTGMSMPNNINNLSMTCQMMWSLVTTNYDSLLTQSVSSMTNNLSMNILPAAAATTAAAAAHMYIR